MRKVEARPEPLNDPLVIGELPPIVRSNGLYLVGDGACLALSGFHQGVNLISLLAGYAACSSLMCFFDLAVKKAR